MRRAAAATTLGPSWRRAWAAPETPWIACVGGELTGRCLLSGYALPPAASADSIPTPSRFPPCPQDGGFGEGERRRAATREVSFQAAQRIRQECAHPAVLHFYVWLLQGALGWGGGLWAWRAGGAAGLDSLLSFLGRAELRRSSALALPN